MTHNIRQNSDRTAYGVKQLLFSTVEEMKAYKLRTTMPGSTALVTGTSETYILSKEYEWKLWKCCGGGGDDPEKDLAIWDSGDIETGVINPYDDNIYLWDGGELKL